MTKNSNYIKYWHGKYNLGDIFSDFLFDSIYDKVLLNKIPYRKILMFIGSEIPAWANDFSLVCGLGWRQKNATMKCQNARPENFLYVRGKISRQRVIDSGIDIPHDLPIGDSGLLASLLYRPHATKKHDIGIITHWSAAPRLQQYLELAKNKFPEKDIAIMQMGDQTKTVLDLFEFICSCKVVVASSLHAIIFSHSFGVPALFFSDVDGYKFQDYYSAYDRINYVELQEKVTLDQALLHIADDKFICSVNPTSEEVKDIQKTILSAFPYKNCFSSSGKKIYQDIVGKEPFSNTSLLQTKNLHIWRSSAVNIQVLIQMLKAFNIKHGIISPGTTHAAFSASILNDPFFKCYSVIDERSASYMAVGMSIELDEPVFVACTGATASRNYIPGATEAYYSNAKVLYITADYGGEKGMNVPQQVDRSIIQKDIVKKSYVIDGDLQTCRRRISEGLNYMFKDEGGPVHFNLISNNRKEFTNNIIEVKPIKYYDQDSELPYININKKLVLVVETHQKFSETQVESINAFCRKYNCVYLENLNNKNPGILYSIPYCTLVAHGKAKYLESDLMIYVGGPYSEYNICKIKAKNLWKIGKDQGKFIDPFKNLDAVFDMGFDKFLEMYNEKVRPDNTELYDSIKPIYDNEYKIQCQKELPFSNIWIAKKMSEKLPLQSKAFFSVLNTYRSWNYWNVPLAETHFKNNGVYGIDGIMSSIIGSSLVSDKLHFCFIGDTAFFYDMNSLGVHYIKNNLRICVINNGGCVEFGNPGHYCRRFSHENWHKEIMMAQGHYANKSTELIRHFSEDLGFKYISASNKEQFESVYEEFIAENDKPIVFECFINDIDDMKALELI